MLKNKNKINFSSLFLPSLFFIGFYFLFLRNKLINWVDSVNFGLEKNTILILEQLLFDIFIPLLILFAIYYHKTLSEIKRTWNLLVLDVILLVLNFYALIEFFDYWTKLLPVDDGLMINHLSGIDLIDFFIKGYYFIDNFIYNYGGFIFAFLMLSLIILVVKVYNKYILYRQLRILNIDN